MGKIEVLMWLFLRGKDFLVGLTMKVAYNIAA